MWFCSLIHSHCCVSTGHMRVPHQVTCVYLTMSRACSSQRQVRVPHQVTCVYLTKSRACLCVTPLPTPSAHLASSTTAHELPHSTLILQPRLKEGWGVRGERGQGWSSCTDEPLFFVLNHSLIVG